VGKSHEIADRCEVSKNIGEDKREREYVDRV
jgi:hypothetical protein